MATSDFLQAIVRPVRVLAAFTLLITVAFWPTAVAADWPDLAATPRQAEIVEELRAYRPRDATPADGAWMLGSWDTDAGLEAFVEFPTGAGNAASRFRMLETLHRESTGGFDAPPDPRAADLLIEAAEMAGCRLSPDEYPAFDRADAGQPDFLVLRTGLQALLNRAEESERLGNNADADRCYRAAILCGRHLTSDRSSTLVYLTGVIFKVRGVRAYEPFLVRSGRGDGAEAARRYLGRIGEILRLFYWKSNVALNELAGFACLPATMAIAREDAEPCWRREAVVRLAVMRHGVPDAATGEVDRNPVCIKAAEDALAWVAANDPEPTVRRLAIWCAINLRP